MVKRTKRTKRTPRNPRRAVRGEVFAMWAIAEQLRAQAGWYYNDVDAVTQAWLVAFVKTARALADIAEGAAERLRGSGVQTDPSRRPH